MRLPPVLKDFLQFMRPTKGGLGDIKNSEWARKVFFKEHIAKWLPVGNYWFLMFTTYVLWTFIQWFNVNVFTGNEVLATSVEGIFYGVLLSYLLGDREKKPAQKPVSPVNKTEEAPQPAQPPVKPPAGLYLATGLNICSQGCLSCLP